MRFRAIGTSRFYFKFLGRLFHGISWVERLYWRNRVKKIKATKEDDNEVWVAGGLTVYGSAAENRLVLNALDYLEQRSLYSLNLIKQSRLSVFFLDRDFHHVSALVDAAYLDRGRKYSIVEVAATLFHKAVRAKCHRLGIPKNWVSRKAISKLTIRCWKTLCCPPD